MTEAALALVRGKGYGPGTAKAFRELAVTWLQASGCTPDQIAGLFGLKAPTIRDQLRQVRRRWIDLHADSVILATCGSCWVRSSEPCDRDMTSRAGRWYGEHWFHDARISRARRRGLLPDPVIREPPELPLPAL